MKIYRVSIINVKNTSSQPKMLISVKKNYVFKFFALTFPFILVYLSPTFQCINICGSEDTNIIVLPNMTLSSHNYRGQKQTKKNRIKRFMRSVQNRNFLTSDSNSNIYRYRYPYTKNSITVKISTTVKQGKNCKRKKTHFQKELEKKNLHKAVLEKN